MPDHETRKIAIGNEYENEMGRPWAYTDLSDIERFEDSDWFIVDLPAKLVDAFEAARAEIDRAVKALIDAAGFDPAASRMVTVCSEYRGA